MPTTESIQAFLEKFVDHVYFNPPTGTKILYPAIIYRISSIEHRYANNNPYKEDTRIQIEYITVDPDDQIIWDLSRIPQCRFIRGYNKDNLLYNVYEVYWNGFMEGYQKNTEEEING